MLQCILRNEEPGRLGIEKQVMMSMLYRSPWKAHGTQMRKKYARSKMLLKSLDCSIRQYLLVGYQRSRRLRLLRKPRTCLSGNSASNQEHNLNHLRLQGLLGVEDAVADPSTWPHEEKY